MEKTTPGKTGIYQQTLLFQKIRKFGLKNIFLCWDFIIPILLALAISISSHNYFSEKIYENILTLLPLFTQVIAALLALSIAGLIFFISSPISDHFTQYLFQHKAYDNILFLYHWSAVISGISIITSILMSVFLPPQTCTLILAIYLLIASFLFLYSICIFINLFSTTARIGHYKKEFFQKYMKNKDT